MAVGNGEQCTVYAVQCTVYSEQCTVYAVHLGIIMMNDESIRGGM